MKRRNSVSFRVNVLILLTAVIIAASLITTAYLTHASEVDHFFMTKVQQTAKTLSTFMDADRMRQLLELLKTPEYQALRSEAAEQENAEAVEAILKEHGFLEYVQRLLRILSDYRDTQGVTYVYLLDMLADQPASMHVGDPDEEIWNLGWIEDDAAGFERTEANEQVKPTVSHTAWGWLASCYEPLVDSTGNRILCIGVDINMDDVMEARQKFLRQMLAFALAITAVAVALAVIQMRAAVTRPITLLSKAVDDFGGGENGLITKDQVIDLPITTKNEIGNLYQKTRHMETRLIDYMDNLASVTAEKERIGAELNIAAQIQADMLPRIFPPFPDHKDFDIFASMDPAKEVGGDFYDFFLVDDDHLCMVMADVSGKGVPAALFMVIAKTLIKNRAMLGESPSDILYNVNNQLCDGNEAELFVTVWLAILDLTTGKGIAVNAGHEHPALRRAGGRYELVEYRHSLAVAAMEGVRFRQHEFQLNPGDSIFVYTDGVPEATSAANELFGSERMLLALNSNPDAEPEQILKNVRMRVDAFVGSAPQFDDMTMLSLHYKGREAE